MNTIAAQKEIFNALVRGEINCRRIEINGREVFITVDGSHGYVIPYAEAMINLEKIPTIENLNLQIIVKEENQCKLTKEALILELPRRVARKLTNGDRAVFFDEKFLKNFQNPKFYNASAVGIIVVTEDISAMRQNQIVGAIMPIRVNSSDFDQ